MKGATEYMITLWDSLAGKSVCQIIQCALAFVVMDGELGTTEIHA